MKAYNAYVGEMKIGTVFEYNIFDATHTAAALFGYNVEVLESRK
jgi:hypothetical protein